MSRLEELKRQNIERFIKAVREDLTKWWDCCFVSEAERQSFTVFFVDVFSEDVLNLHEAEVEKFKSLYHNNKDIFTKVVLENFCRRTSAAQCIIFFPFNRFNIVKICGSVWRTLKQRVATRQGSLAIEAVLYSRKKKSERKL